MNRGAPLLRYFLLASGAAGLTHETPATIKRTAGAHNVAIIRPATSDDVAYFESKGVPRPAVGRLKGEPA